MLHAPINTRRHAQQDASMLPPLTPADYLRLRREAAGLSIAKLASLLAVDGKQHEAETYLRLIETPGARVSRTRALDRLRSVFPFDPAVYQQLCDEPTDRHPRICRGCGCSEWDPCDTDGRGACGWSTESSCTRCAPEAGEP